MNTMKTPDITPAQIIATVSSLAGLFLTQGLIDNRTEKLVTGIAAIVVPLIWIAADALIRHGRSRSLEIPPRPPTEG